VTSSYDQVLAAAFTPLATGTRAVVSTTTHLRTTASDRGRIEAPRIAGAWSARLRSGATLCIRVVDGSVANRSRSGIGNTGTAGREMSDESRSDHDRPAPEQIGPYAKLVAAALAALGVSERKAAALITDSAWDLDQKRTTVHASAVSRWLSGTIAQPNMRRWTSHALRIPLDKLNAAADEQRNLLREHHRAEQRTPRVALLHVHDSDSEIEIGQVDAVNFTTWIESTNTNDEVIEQFELLTLSAARNHVQEPPGTVIRRVLDTHRQVQTLLQGGRQRVRQTRELFRIDAQLLAHLCLLLGDVHHDQAAMAYGAASILAANEAGSSPAEAFSAQAQLARWRNRYTDAADLAAAGHAASQQGSLRLLLACQEANAAALAGDTKRAHQAMARAEAADIDNAADSAWTCPPARHALYRLAVALHCGDPSEALHQAAIAKAAWPPGQSAPFGTSAHTRIASAIAYLKLDALDVATEQIVPVLELPDEYRLATLIEHMASFDALLGDSRAHRSREGKQLRSQIAEFMRRARQHHLAMERT
jgi:hypothetical protein